MTYTANYPPAQSSTYVKASSYIGGFDPFYATDPALSLTGDCTGTSWLSGTTAVQKIVVDFGSAVAFDRLYLDNYHHYGGYTTRGIYQYRLYGSNSSEALTRYANSTDLTDLTLIGSYTAAEHVASDTSDPQFFVLDGNDYQYAVLIIDANFGGVYHGIRHFEIQSEDAEELVTLEIGWKHVWDVMDALESGWEHNWTNIWQNVERGFDHSWNCIIEQGWQHKWGELPVLERGWDHRWGCLHVLTQGWAHNWQTLKTFEGGFEHTWNDLLSIETGWQHTWDGLNAPIETGWQHVWDVKETTTLERGWCHTWVVCGENVDNEFVIKCTLKGQPISCTDIQLEGSRTDCSISLDGSLPEYIERIHGRALPLDIGKACGCGKGCCTCRFVHAPYRQRRRLSHPGRFDLADARQRRKHPCRKGRITSLPAETALCRNPDRELWPRQYQRDRRRDRHSCRIYTELADDQLVYSQGRALCQQRIPPAGITKNHQRHRCQDPFLCRRHFCY